MARCPDTVWLHVAMTKPWQKGVDPVQVSERVGSPRSVAAQGFDSHQGSGPTDSPAGPGGGCSQPVALQPSLGRVAETGV